MCTACCGSLMNKIVEVLHWTQYWDSDQGEALPSASLLGNQLGSRFSPLENSCFPREDRAQNAINAAISSLSYAHLAQVSDDHRRRDLDATRYSASFPQKAIAAADAARKAATTIFELIQEFPGEYPSSPDLTQKVSDMEQAIDQLRDKIQATTIEEHRLDFNADHERSFDSFDEMARRPNIEHSTIHFDLEDVAVHVFDAAELVLEIAKKIIEKPTITKASSKRE